MRRDGFARKGRGALAVFVADHGIAEESVSAFPKAVTLEMLRNIAGGGAAISVLARRFGYKLRVIDMGVETDTSAEPFSGVTYRRIGPGTRNFLKGNAMTSDEARRAIEIGIAIAREFAASGVALIGIGEMGIANSTSAAAVISAATGIPPARLAGRGTGLDDTGWKHKIEVIERALALHRKAFGDGIEILTAVGGFEIAAMAGVCWGSSFKHPGRRRWIHRDRGRNRRESNFPRAHRAYVFRPSLRRRRPSRSARMASRATDSGSRDAPRRRHRCSPRDTRSPASRKRPHRNRVDVRGQQAA